MKKKISILLVDDDIELLKLVRANLESGGYTVQVAMNAHSALESIDLEMPDVILLDIMLPEIDGYNLCQRIREFSDIPIIMLTAKFEDSDKVRGLKLGADDYITKPFNVQELLARIESVLRRSGRSEEAKFPPSFVCGDVNVNFAQRRVTVRGQEVSLTLTEYKLLSHLVSNAGRVMLRRELLTRVWGPEYHNEMEYLRAYILHLRQKIEVDPHDPKYILSKPGIGYVFVSPS
jgi:two-component system KDP operon response regulator KdpE